MLEGLNTKVGNNAIDMEVNKRLLAFFAEEEVTVLVVVHEEVFGEDGRAGGVAEDLCKVFYYVKPTHSRCNRSPFLQGLTLHNDVNIFVLSL